MYGIFTYIYLHLVCFYGFHVGKYTSPMDAMGNDDASLLEISPNTRTTFSEKSIATICANNLHSRLHRNAAQIQQESVVISCTPVKIHIALEHPPFFGW